LTPHVDIADNVSGTLHESLCASTWASIGNVGKWQFATARTEGSYPLLKLFKRVRFKAFAERVGNVPPSRDVAESQGIRCPVHGDLCAVSDAIPYLVDAVEVRFQRVRSLSLPRQTIENVVNAEPSKKRDDVFVARVSPTRPSGMRTAVQKSATVAAG